MNFQINLNQLQVFNAVIRTKNIKDAGELLNISAPAVSIQIKNLEQALGFKVFKRRANGLELEEDAKFLVAYTRKIFEQLELLNSKIILLQDKKNSTVTIGIHVTPAEFLGPLLFNYVKQHLPNLELAFVHAEYDDLIDMLRTQKVDIAIKADMFSFEDIMQQKFIPFRIPFVVSSKNSIINNESNSLEKLSSIPILLGPIDSSFSQHVYRFFIENNIPLPINEINMPPNLNLKFVEKTFHGTFYNSLGCEDLLEDGRLAEVKLEKNPEDLNFYIAYTEESLKEKKIFDLLNLLKDYEEFEKFRKNLK